MINTEQLIKRRAVSHDAYNLHGDSDEELRQMEHQENQSRNGRNKKYSHHGRRKRRYHDPRFFENDSDFEYDDEEKAESERKLKSNTLPKGVFDKKPIKPLSQH